MAFTLILLAMSLLIIIGYLLKENAKTIRRAKAEEKAEQAQARADELADKLSRSYSRVTCRTIGIMPELHKK